jgi:hypothetical protein
MSDHCNMQGNERADRLAKEGKKLPQYDCFANYEQAKRIIKFHINDKVETRLSLIQ